MNPDNKTGGPSFGAVIASFASLMINIVLFPVTFVGYVIWIGKLIISGRSSGISVTAQGPLSVRWAQHNLGIRKDEASNRLLPVLPGFSILGLRLTSFPMILAHKLTGHVPKMFSYPYQGDVPKSQEASARGTFFDNIIDKYLVGTMQFVILGAGFDTRAFRLPENSGIKSFEIDMPNTQSIKRGLLEKAGIDTTGVVFVSADFEKDDWFKELVDAGFDTAKPAFFLWEGVTMYMDRQAIESTLRKIASTAAGSAVAFDYFTDESLLSDEFYWKFARVSTKAAGEPLKFGFDSTPPSGERLKEFLKNCGLSLVESRVLGKETEGKTAWGGFAVASVK
jgi:methyltransferase (TIGR00027 family)